MQTTSERAGRAAWGRALREERLGRGLSLRDAANLVGVGTQFTYRDVAAAEAGERDYNCLGMYTWALGLTLSVTLREDHVEAGAL